MKRRRTIVSLAALAIGSGTTLAADESSTAAQAVVRDWLRKLDSADDAGTWESAASVFKAAVSASAWQQAAQSVRAQLGPVRARTEKSATFARSLPGVPDGQYVVMQFDAAFEKKAKAIETVTVARDRDGAWRVAGYFVD